MGCFKWGFTFEGPRLKQPILKRGLYILFIDVDAQNIFSDSDLRSQRPESEIRIRSQSSEVSYLFIYSLLVSGTFSADISSPRTMQPFYRERKSVVEFLILSKQNLNPI